MVECVFEDYKGGAYKVISFHAKRARGLMARYAIEHRITTPEGLKHFDSEGYAHAPEVSGLDRLVSVSYTHLDVYKRQTTTSATS